MYKLEFANGSTSKVVSPAACPICRALGSDLTLSVCLEDSPSDVVDIFTCRECGSRYVSDPSAIKSYSEFSGYWHRYVQNGAGITAMLDPLFALGDIKGNLLDVGCGFGFVPHYWNTMGYGRAVGLEASEYGQVGREKLSVEIYSQYYKDATQIHGEKFDYVLSSEVLEHVSDPVSFIKEISGALSDSGVLVLTTPSSRAVRDSTELPTLIAAVSPFLHYFMISASALEGLLQKSGFQYVQVHDDGIRLYAWASNEQLPPISIGFTKWSEYFNFLIALSRNPDHHVAGGALYRLLKDGINTGQMYWAEQAYLRFRSIAQDAYNIDFDDPAPTAERSRQSKPLESEHFPAWAGCGLLFAARYKEHFGAPSESVADLARSALICMEHEIRVGAAFAQEAKYFKRMAQELVDKLDAEQISSRRLRSVTHLPLKVLRQPGSMHNREVCLVVGYAPDGRLSPAAKSLIEAFSKEYFDCIICYVVQSLDAAIHLEGAESAVGVIARVNGGYDFAAWSAILEVLPGLWAAKRLVFVNDSIIGPGETFPATIKRVRESQSDYLALVESNEPVHHTQSFFFVLQHDAVTSKALKDFWRSIRVQEEKQAVIDAYEIKTLQYVEKIAGLKAEILFPMSALFPGANSLTELQLNPTHELWETLLHHGFPFVKAELLHRNPMGLHLRHWQPLLAAKGFNMAMVKSHLEEMDRVRPSLSAAGRNIVPEDAPVRLRWRWLKLLLGKKHFAKLRGWRIRYLGVPKWR